MTNVYIESFLLQKYFTVDLSQKAGKWLKKNTLIDIISLILPQTCDK